MLCEQVRACLVARIAIVCGALLLVATQAQADQSRASKRARTFLDKKSVGTDVLTLVHFGARYDGQTYSDVRGVKRDGKIVSGHFGLVYDYKWEGDGRTKIAFLCDQDGDIYDVQILYTNAQFNQPFVLAKVSISVVGNGILQAIGDQSNKSDLEKLQSIITDADPKALLIFVLQLRQALER